MSILKLNLPMEVLEVEGYFKWLTELLPHLQQSAAAQAKDLGKYLEDLAEEQVDKITHEFCGVGRILEMLDAKEKGDGEEDGGGGEEDEETEKKDENETDNEEQAEGKEEDEESEPTTNNLPRLAWSLNLATFYIFIRKLEEPKSMIEDCRKTILLITENGDEKVEGPYLDAATYLMDILEFCRKVIEMSEPSKDANEKEGSKIETELAGDQAELLQKDKEELQKRWAKIGNDKRVQATLCFFKRAFAIWLHVNNQKILSLCEETIKLDPDYPIWYYCAYETVRAVRIRDNINGYRTGPSPLERHYCEIAYQLCPNDILNAINYGTLLKEILWPERFQFWEENEDDVMECVRRFDKALEMLETTEYRILNKIRLVRTVKMQFADFLLFGKSSKLDRERGKQLLDECYKTHPTSTQVLHKMAKVYHYGIFGPSQQKLFVNYELAEKFYFRAIYMEPTNFPCVMDCLKLLNLAEDKTKMIGLINFSRKHSRSDIHVAKLRIEKGMLIWLYNPLKQDLFKEMACKCWLIALEKGPPLLEKIIELITNGSAQMRRYYGKIVDTKEVIRTLEKLSCSMEVTSERKKTISLLLQKLSYQNYRTHNQGASYIESGRSRGRSTFMSEADKDDNWRR